MLRNNCNFIQILQASIVTASEYEYGVYSTLVIQVGVAILGVLRKQASILIT
jgi:hypothetical protein